MKLPDTYLTKREQQLMEVLFQLGSATANELLEKLPGEPSNSTVRTRLRVLEQKGVVRHEEQGGHFVFHPVHKTEEAAGTALTSVVKTFFKGSISQTVAALLTNKEAQVSKEELDELEQLIAKAKEEGR